MAIVRYVQSFSPSKPLGPVGRFTSSGPRHEPQPSFRQAHRGAPAKALFSDLSYVCSNGEACESCAYCRERIRGSQRERLRLTSPNVTKQDDPSALAQDIFNGSFTPGGGGRGVMAGWFLSAVR